MQKILTKITTTLIILSISVLTLSNCRTKTGNKSSYTQTIDYYTASPSISAFTSKSQLIEMIRRAKNEITFVASSFDDVEIANEIIKARDKGIKVLGAGNNANAGESGFVTLGASGISLRFNTTGRVEETFLVVDRGECWLSTGGISAANFSGAYNVSLKIKSFVICDEFVNEGNQMANGGMFSDVGSVSFGDFVHLKTQTDPNTRFELDQYIIHLYFGAQEKPATLINNFLIQATSSVKFMARSITQNILKNATVHDANRSHILNILQYKNKINTLYGGVMNIKGVVDDQLIASDSCPGLLAMPTTGNVAVSTTPTIVTGTATSFTTELSVGDRVKIGNNTAFVSEITDNTSLILTSPGVASTSAVTLFRTAKQSFATSIHCDLKYSLGTKVKKYTGANAIGFNLYLLDVNGYKPLAIISSSDLRLVNGFDITDSWLMIIEPRSVGSDRSLFNSLSSMIDSAYANGVNL